MKRYCVFQLLLRLLALPHASLAPPRNPSGECFIAQLVAHLFQPSVRPLLLQIGEHFLQWHILAQGRQFAEKQRLSPVLGQAFGSAGIASRCSYLASAAAADFATSFNCTFVHW
ncbi:MAG TPA: hypothetical protein VFV38_38400 [Ktedonobacteraceae bacterium]|nr:hypothetical protein [Ktedonobacteraceae bacterium]